MRKGMLIVALWALSGCNAHPPTKSTVAKTEVNQLSTAQEAPRVAAANYTAAAQINVQMGLEYLKQGHTALAKSKLLHALKLDPSSAASHSAMAYFWETVQENKEAEREYRKALRLTKQKGAVYNNFATFLCRQNRYLEADKTFKLALEDKSYPESANVFENAGLCAAKNRNFAGAEHYLQNALRHDPSKDDVLLELARVQFSMGHLNQAKTSLEHYKKHHTPSAEAVYVEWKIAQALHNTEEAIALEFTLKSQYPDFLDESKLEEASS